VIARLRKLSTYIVWFSAIKIPKKPAVSALYVYPVGRRNYKSIKTSAAIEFVVAKKDGTYLATSVSR
jgi:hypothetical protein